MKKHFIIVLFSLLSISSFGQKIRFSDSSNVWNMYFVSNGVVPQYGYAFTYTYAGNFSIHDTTYRMLLNSNNKSVAYIREDTIGKKVFAKMSESSIGETLLYDYNLHLEDSFSYGNTMYYVSGIDTVLVDSSAYRTWGMQWDSTSYSAQENIIEEIGSIEGPLSPALPTDSTGHIFLKCFKNRNSTPVLSHVVGLYFDNATSCASTFGVYAGVNSVTNPNDNATLFPDPIDESSKIVLPYNLTSGRLMISNDIGQTIINTSFQNKDEVVIGDKVYTPGIYFYRVTDNQTGRAFSGKFMYR